MGKVLFVHVGFVHEGLEVGKLTGTCRKNGQVAPAIPAENSAR